MSERCRSIFLAAPTAVLQAAISLIPKAPLLAFGCNLQGGLQLLRDQAGPAGKGDRKMTFDQGTQTVVHVTEKRIEYNYDWNLWSLRRK